MRGAGLQSARLGFKHLFEADSSPESRTNEAHETAAQPWKLGWGPKPPRLTPTPTPTPHLSDAPDARAWRLCDRHPEAATRHHTSASPQNEHREAFPQSNFFPVKTPCIGHWVMRQTHGAGGGPAGPTHSRGGLRSPRRPRTHSPRGRPCGRLSSPPPLETGPPRTGRDSKRFP